MLEESADLWCYIHREAAGGRRFSALRRWEHSEDEFGQRLGRDYYSRPESWVDDLWRKENQPSWFSFAASSFGEILAGFLDLSVDRCRGSG